MRIAFFHGLSRYTQYFLGTRRVANSDDNLEDMLPVDQFHAELVREILRAERSNLPLTLLLLAVAGPANSAEERSEGFQWLARTVLQNTRKCDTRGWYEDERGRWIGVLLFNTRPDTIEPIMVKLRPPFEQRCRDQGVPHKLHYDVLSYPPEESGPPKRNVRNGHQAPTAPRLDERQWTKAEGLEFRGSEPRQSPPASLEALMAVPEPCWKRTLDLLGAVMLLAVFSPLMLGIAICVRLSSAGPILFRQERIGQCGRLFQCFKFRSMRVDFDQEIHRRHVERLICGCNGDPMHKLDGDNMKITRIGRLLRPSHLDELPQLINVMRGEMSLVGPRPCIPYEAAVYLPWCRRRFDYLPGITGLWQVRGRNNMSFQQMVRLDLEYGRRQSLRFDLMILLLTVPTIIQDAIANI